MNQGEIKAAQMMLDALYAALNLQACVQLGSRTPAMKGLDVDSHWREIKSAIARAESTFGLEPQ